MNEVVKLIMEIGVTGAIMTVIIFLGFKYLPKLFDLLLEKSKKRDYREDLLLETVKNNTRVIENNSVIIKNFTDNSNKLEKAFEKLENNFIDHDKRLQEVLLNTHVIKEKQ